MENLNTNLDYALYYAEKLGFSVIPIKAKSKKPNISGWLKYQKEKPSSEVIKNWWKYNPECGIGIICGSISGIVVVDIDNHEVFKKTGTNLPPTSTVQTSKGHHYYYSIPKGVVIKSCKLAHKNVPYGDFKSEGGYVVVPPSIHETGTQYKWLINLNEIASLPGKFSKTTDKQENAPKLYKNLLGTEKIAEGSRNDSLTSLCGKLMDSISPNEWDNTVWPLLVAQNEKHCKLPLPESELRSIFNSIAKINKNNDAQDKKTKKLSHADLAVKFVMETLNIEPFHDNKDGLFVRVKINDHYENWNCDSQELKNWISKEFYDSFKSVLRPDVMRSIVEMLKGKAKFEGKMYKLRNRFYYENEVLFYDLVSKNWDAVQIDKDGWKIIKDVPPLFKRFTHQQEQVIPKAGGNINDIFKFVNIQKDEQKVLFLVFMISAFIPDFPHPMPYFYGAHGSAKSTVCRNLRKIIDPSVMWLGSFPKNEVELVQIFDHHAIYFFDNMSFIKDYQSDILCKVITGGSFSKRKLYSDSDDVIFTFKKTIGMNGISMVLIRPDILERSLLFPLTRFKDSERKEEGKIDKEFEDAMPYILGSIFKTISKAIEYKKDIKLNNPPRMADFAIWGVAIAKALGYKNDEFINAYMANIEDQNKEVLYEDPVASAITSMFYKMYRKHTRPLEWTGTANILLHELKEHALDEKILPRSASALSKKINAIEIPLKEAGITVERKIMSSMRQIKLSQNIEVAVVVAKEQGYIESEIKTSVPVNEPSRNKNYEN